MSTKSKFTLIMVLTSLIGAIVFGFLSFLESRNSLREAAFDELTAIRTARASQIEAYFDTVFKETNVISENPLVSDSVVAFRQAFNAIEAVQGLEDVNFAESLEQYYSEKSLPELSTYIENGDATYGGFSPKTQAGKYLQFRYIAQNPHSRFERAKLTKSLGQTDYAVAHEKYHSELKFIVNQFEYYDMFLIDHETGNIVYTSRKETDFATNIYDGPYRASRLGEVVDRVKDDPSQGAVYMSDYEFYLPSNNRPAIFIASGIYENDRLEGIVAIQLTIDDIDKIMTSGGQWKSVGLKNTGETYIVGADYKMRNNSRFAAEDFDNYLVQIRQENVSEKTINQIKERKSSVLIQVVKTRASEQALAGKTDTEVIEDYRGVPVLSAYTPFEIKGQTFAILAEIDAAEAFEPVTRLMMRTAITTAIVIPLSAIAGIWLSSMLMRPAREMGTISSAFLKGDETARFDNTRKDEWGTLSNNMNSVLDTAKARLVDADTARAEIQDMTTRLMPNAIAERFSKGERDIISHEDAASAAVFFLNPSDKLNDLANAAISRRLYEQLDDALDELATRDGVDMLNQAGMGYLGFCGLTSPMKNHAERLFRFTCKAAKCIEDFNAEHGTDIEYRIGIHTGPMFGALIGNYSLAYEIWGDAVLTAFDLAHSAPTGSLNISEVTNEQIELQQKSKRVTVILTNGENIKARQVATPSAGQI